MEKTIQIQFFANLSAFTPKDSGQYLIVAGTTVRTVLEDIGVPTAAAKLIFIDGKKADLSQVLKGGERVGVFPPVAGG